MKAVVSARLDRVDALRGFALVWMALFHLAFDLNYFGWLDQRYNFHRDPLWTTQRTMILSLFLVCAGLGQSLALGDGGSGPQRAGAGPAGIWARGLAAWQARFPARFWRRWAQVAGCAALVSLGSAWMFPRSWISFGVLHGLAVMLILVRLLAPLRGGLWLVGGLALALPWLWRHPIFDLPALQWVGLVTRKPITEDWVPVLPWLGVMLWGLAAGQWLQRHRPGWLGGGVAAPLQPLAVLGRWSLSFYMVHQPVFIGVLLALGWLGLR